VKSSREQVKAAADSYHPAITGSLTTHDVLAVVINAISHVMNLPQREALSINIAEHILHERQSLVYERI
jgi:hypothetical protein